MRRGFSLVELSIVLVILGLLTGGILAGRSLIRASELRAVTAEHSKYHAAYHAFRDKYLAIPGDMPNATSFWGKDNTNCSGDTGTAATPGTCNGNGNGFMTGPGGGNTTAETFRFWQHMALAGIIEGVYSGLSGSGGGLHHVPGTNVPASKLSGASWGVREYYSYLSGDGSFFDAPYGNIFAFGKPYPNADNGGSILIPEEAWNIDTKIDNGMPGTGKVIARPWGSSCNTATSSANSTATYSLSNTTVYCSLTFPKFVN